MNTMPLPDRNYLDAAEGWLELGNLPEAEAELDRIGRHFRSLPQVLEVECRILAHAGRWPQCLRAAEQLTDAAPRRAAGWLFVAEALRGLELAEDAWETLANVADDFPDEPELHYRLACYASAIGACEEAAEALERVLTLSDQRQWKARAVAEPDLVALWQYLNVL